MMKLKEIVSFLDGEYPVELAEEWDNVGLLIGDSSKNVNRIMTCLTVSPKVCDEAVREKIDLIVSHHPFPFRALKRITSENIEGGMLLKLIGNDIAVYSPHTAHDSAPDGINRQLAMLLDLENVTELNENGSGRIGDCRQEGLRLDFLLDLVRSRIGDCSYVGKTDQPINRIAIGCGAADGFIEESVKQGADLLLVGEARFHACLEAESRGLALILPGHFASERFAVETLAEKITTRLPGIDCFASRCEYDIIKRF